MPRRALGRVPNVTGTAAEHTRPVGPDSIKRMSKNSLVPALSGVADVTALASKLCNPDQLMARLATLARPLVFTNGVFDVLHRGHVVYLCLLYTSRCV